MPRRTPQENRPENPRHRGETKSLGIDGVLGPRAEEIAAAAQSLGVETSTALVRLAAVGNFSVTRPRSHPDKFGAEHDVYLAADGLRVFKHARNHGFGPTIENGKLAMKPCSPHEYLARHALMEEIFPTEVQIEGLTDLGHFVISQRAIKGNHPTEAAIRKFLTRLGFINIPARFGQGGEAWFHYGLGVLIMDTAPDNFIAPKQGIVPIDLQIAKLNDSLLDLADKVVLFLKNAPQTHL